MPNIFVLCTGRCGSTTFAEAAGHALNFTSGHETRSHRVGSARLNYPRNHIEIDNRLSWFLGRLERYWGDDALYVHLERDRDATARSFVTRKGYGIMKAYDENILMRAYRGNPNLPSLDIAYDLIDTVTENIRAFLAHRRHHMHVQLETAVEDFATFWDWAGLEGDLEAALAEWKINHNATEPGTQG